MNLTQILSVEGKNNLFKHVANGRNGIIVENIDTNKRTILHDYHKISVLSEISMFESLGNDKLLSEIYDDISNLENNKQTSVDHTAEETMIVGYFEKVYPTYHKGKVKLSDMRKAIEWYNILISKDLLTNEMPIDGEGVALEKPELNGKTNVANSSKKSGVKPNSKSVAKNTNTVRKMA